MNDIPFTHGPLRDWPLVEEMVDKVLTMAADVRGAHLDEEYRTDVLEQVKEAYGHLNAEGPLHLSVDRETADVIATIQEWYDRRLRAAFFAVIALAVKNATLRRQLRNLGGNEL